MTRNLEGDLNGEGMKVALVSARFNEFVTSRLLKGALEMLLARGVRDDDITVVHVPGAFEIPGAGAQLLQRQDIDGAVGIGAVIQGDTAHFDYVCQGVTKGVMDAGLKAGKPFIFSVLTVDTVDQAMERAEERGNNKGAEGALAVMEMIDLYRQISGAPGSSC